MDHCMHDLDATTVAHIMLQVLANQVRTAVGHARHSGSSDVGNSFNPSTANMLRQYLSHR